MFMYIDLPLQPVCRLLQIDVATCAKGVFRLVRDMHGDARSTRRIDRAHLLENCSICMFGQPVCSVYITSTLMCEAMLKYVSDECFVR